MKNKLFAIIFAVLLITTSQGANATVIALTPEEEASTYEYYCEGYSAVKPEYFVVIDEDWDNQAKEVARELVQKLIKQTGISGREPILFHGYDFTSCRRIHVEEMPFSEVSVDRLRENKVTFFFIGDKAIKIFGRDYQQSWSSDGNPTRSLSEDVKDGYYDKQVSDKMSNLLLQIIYPIDYNDPNWKAGHVEVNERNYYQLWTSDLYSIFSGIYGEESINQKESNAQDDPTKQEKLPTEDSQSSGSSVECTPTEDSQSSGSSVEFLQGFRNRANMGGKLTEKALFRCGTPGRSKSETCILEGLRKNKDGVSKYCSVSGFWRNQRPDGSPAENNYECLSNSARYGECENIKEQTGAIKKIFGWLSKLFD